MTKRTRRSFFIAATAPRPRANSNMQMTIHVFRLKGQPGLDEVKAGDKIRVATEKVGGHISVVKTDTVKKRPVVQSLLRQALAICAGLVAALPLPLRAVEQRAEASAFRHEIRPGKIAEECRNLASDERVRYRFEASAAVPFNVHFHRGGAVEYPVKIDKTTDAASILTASSEQDFCWMWANETSETIVVHGELVRTK